VEQLLEVDDGDRVFAFQWNRDARQRFSELHWPQSDLWPFITAADHDGVVVLNQSFDLHPCAALQQVDFHEVNITGR
jgi:hypothetical protein